jgi:hypothetical protein
MSQRLTTIISFSEQWVVTAALDLNLAHQCLEGWLECLVRGEFASVPPFGQMFVYQLNTQEQLGCKAFAVGELYKLYYRTADRRTAQCKLRPGPAF